MVTTSDLEKLNVINERTEKDVHYHGNFIPHSISWMLPPDRIDHHEQNSLVTKLRNKRLHYLFESQNNDDVLDNHEKENDQVNDITDSTSFDYPTTQLKPHELTNKLEIELIESSFFGNKSDNHNQTESSIHFNRNTQGTSSSSVLQDDSFQSILTSNLILPHSRGIENSSIVDLIQLARDASSVPVTRLCSYSPIAKSNPRKHSLLNSPTTSLTRPNKKFKSRSQCDLVFPNMEFKKAG